MSPPITDTSGRRMEASGLSKLSCIREEEGCIQVLVKSDTFGRRMNVSGLSESWALGPAFLLAFALMHLWEELTVPLEPFEQICR